LKRQADTHLSRLELLHNGVQVLTGDAASVSVVYGRLTRAADDVPPEHLPDTDHSHLNDFMQLDSLEGEWALREAATGRVLKQGAYVARPGEA